MPEYEETMDAALGAYEQSTGDIPDTRDYVTLENIVKDYVDEANNK